MLWFVTAPPKFKSSTFSSILTSNKPESQPCVALDTPSCNSSASRKSGLVTIECSVLIRSARAVVNVRPALNRIACVHPAFLIKELFSFLIPPPPIPQVYIVLSHMQELFPRFRSMFEKASVIFFAMPPFAFSAFFRIAQPLHRLLLLLVLLLRLLLMGLWRTCLRLGSR